MSQTTEKQEKPNYNVIPVQLSEQEFETFSLPHLSLPQRGPDGKIGYHKAFNDLLKVLYTGRQWKELPREKGPGDKAEIHYTGLYKLFARGADDGALEKAFIAAVKHLSDENKLDLSWLHGDGSNTVATGAGVGYSGHQHPTGEKVIAISDNQGYVLSPLTIAPVNRSDSVLVPDGSKDLKRVAAEADLELKGATLKLDAGFDRKANRKGIFNAGMKPNLKQKPRNRKTIQRGRQRFFDDALYLVRFTLERVFAWEDKFKRLVLRYETKQKRHLGFKLIAFSLINLREFCEG